MAEPSTPWEQEILALDRATRAKLAAVLLDSLNEPEPAVDRLWLEEAQSRIEAYRAGAIKAVTTEEFFRGMNRS